MTPEERVSAWMQSEEGMDALRHACADPDRVGEQVAAMIRAAVAEERGRCYQAADRELERLRSLGDQGSAMASCVFLKGCIGKREWTPEEILRQEG